MKRVIIIFAVLGFMFSSCVKEVIKEVEEIVEVNKKIEPVKPDINNFNMPLISSNYDEVKAYLAKLDKGVIEWDKEGKKYLHAYIAVNKEDILKEVTYIFDKEGDNMEYLGVNFVYNTDTPNAELKQMVRTAIIESTTFSFK